MRFCYKCGTPLDESYQFCTRCGTYIGQEYEYQTYNQQQEILLPSNALYNSDQKHKKVRRWVAVLLPLFAVFVAICVVLSLFAPKGFNVEYSTLGVTSFLSDVCKRVDGKAVVSDPDYDSPASMYGHCIVSSVNVKLPGKIAQEVYIRFYNSSSSDTVSKAEFTFSSFTRGSFSSVDYENVFNCEKSFLIALEKTIAGKSYAEDYIRSYSKLQSMINKTPVGEKQVIAEYELSPGLLVVIESENSAFGGGWIRYNITKNDLHYLKQFIN